MTDAVIVWDLETVPDLGSVGRLLSLTDKSVAEIREAMGDTFPKLPLHSIACIGALIATRQDEGWRVDALGAPHIGERSEADLIAAFVNRIAELRPQLVTFNGHSFDLPVLRYRAMFNRVAAPGLQQRNYFNRYSNDALDLCDVLASYDTRGRMKLDELSRVLGLRGKPDGIDGEQVEELVRAGRIQDVANYCECDVVNTYGIWLRYQLFLGALDPKSLAWSENQLIEFIRARRSSNPFLLAEPQPPRIDDSAAPAS